MNFVTIRFGRIMLRRLQRGNGEALDQSVRAVGLIHNASRAAHRSV